MSGDVKEQFNTFKTNNQQTYGSQKTVINPYGPKFGSGSIFTDPKVIDTLPGTSVWSSFNKYDQTWKYPTNNYVSNYKSSVSFWEKLAKGLGIAALIGTGVSIVGGLVTSFASLFGKKNKSESTTYTQNGGSPSAKSATKAGNAVSTLSTALTTSDNVENISDLDELNKLEGDLSTALKQNTISPEKVQSSIATLQNTTIPNYKTQLKGKEAEIKANEKAQAEIKPKDLDKAVTDAENTKNKLSNQIAEMKNAGQEVPSSLMQQLADAQKAVDDAQETRTKKLEELKTLQEENTKLHQEKETIEQTIKNAETELKELKKAPELYNKGLERLKFIQSKIEALKETTTDNKDE